jgi:phosphate:Na+ symporter
MDFSQVQIWFLLAGLGLFLFGMFILEEALKGLVGRSFKLFLRKYTKRPFQAILAGTAATAVLQSSAMVILLVMSLAGAGVIGLESGIGMIMGANLGTTATGWIVSLIGFQFKISSFVFPLIAIGGIGSVFVKNDKWLQIFRFLLGFSLMFLGLDYMKNGFESFAANADLSFLEGKNFLLFILTGAILSAGIQSSSGAMMIFLSSLAAGVITLEQGFYLVIGADVGTTITAIIGTFGGNSIRRKVGWAQFVYNFITAIIGVFLVGLLGAFIKEVVGISEPTIALVMFHSLFNLVGIILTLPFLKYFTKMINKIIPTVEDTKAKYLMLVNPEETVAAIEALEKESVIFIHIAMEVNSPFFNQTAVKIPEPDEGYFELKEYEAEVVDFYMKVLQRPLDKSEVNKVNQLNGVFRNATLSAKDLKDVRVNLEALKESGSDHLFDFHKKICENQNKLYGEIRQLLHHIEKISAREIDQLDILQMNYHREETQMLQRIFNESKHRDVDMPSLLNMIREINNSNEALLNSLQHLTELKKITSP